MEITSVILPLFRAVWSFCIRVITIVMLALAPPFAAPPPPLLWPWSQPKKPQSIFPANLIPPRATFPPNSMGLKWWWSGSGSAAHTATKAKITMNFIVNCEFEICLQFNFQTNSSIAFHNLIISADGHGLFIQLFSHADLALICFYV